MAADLKPDLNHGLRPIKRIIAAHDAHGKGVYADSPPLLYMDVGGAYASARSYAVESIPAPLTGDQDLKSYLSTDAEKNVTSHLNNSITIPGGVNMVAVNFAPGAQTAMHRTVSVDFAICIEGEVEMELDGGEKRVIGPGDTIIQRATMHRWTNLSKDKGARLIAVTISSEQIEVGGKPIELEFLQE